MNSSGRSLFVDHAAVILDPVQVGGDSGENSWEVLLAAQRQTEGGGTDQIVDVAFLVNQRTARVTLAGGLAALGAHADDFVGDEAHPVLVAPLGAHDGLLHVAQHGRDSVRLVAVQTPARGDGQLISIGGIATVLLGQSGGSDAIVELQLSGQLDQGNVVDDQLGIPVLVHNDAALLHMDAVLSGLLLLDLGGAHIDGHRISRVCAMGSGQDPAFGDQGATAPGTRVTNSNAQSHLVGELAHTSHIAIGDATLQWSSSRGGQKSSQCNK